MLADDASYVIWFLMGVLLFQQLCWWLVQPVSLCQMTPSYAYWCVGELLGLCDGCLLATPYSNWYVDAWLALGSRYNPCGIVLVDVMMVVGWMAVVLARPREWAICEAKCTTY